MQQVRKVVLFLPNGYPKICTSSTQYFFYDFDCFHSFQLLLFGYFSTKICITLIEIMTRYGIFLTFLIFFFTTYYHKQTFYAPKIIVKYSTVFLTVIENVHDCVQFGELYFTF
jgi:hypothetical protein